MDDEPMEVVAIGEVAAQNIALALNLPNEHVDTIKRAIGDEINAMSAHFTMAFADIRDQYEVELANVRDAHEEKLAQVKSSYVFVEDNAYELFTIAALLLTVGLLIGHLA